MIFILNIGEIDPEIENHIIWLKNNISPESIVIEKWNKTFDLRKKNILAGGSSKDLLENWPILKQKIATSLVILILLKHCLITKNLLFTD